MYAFPAHLWVREFWPQIYSLWQALDWGLPSKILENGQGLECWKVNFLQYFGQGTRMPFTFQPAFRALQQPHIHTYDAVIVCVYNMAQFQVWFYCWSVCVYSWTHQGWLVLWFEDSPLLYTLYQGVSSNVYRYLKQWSCCALDFNLCTPPSIFSACSQYEALLFQMLPCNENCQGCKK